MQPRQAHSDGTRALVAGGPGVHARDGADVDADGPARRTSSAGKKSVRGSSAKSKPPTARKPAVKSGTKREESPTAKTKVATESAAEQIPVAGEPAAEPIPVAGEPAARIPVVPYAPYGPGSARAGADGSGPQGWLVKGRSDTRLYYTPEDPTYDPTVAQVWFQDEESAARAFFTPWRKSTRRT